MSPRRLVYGSGKTSMSSMPTAYASIHPEVWGMWDTCLCALSPGPASSTGPAASTGDAASTRDAASMGHAASTGDTLSMGDAASMGHALLSMSVRRLV